MKKLTIPFLTLFLCVTLVGCNPGQQPSGMSDTDAKATIEALPPEDKIRAIASSPMTPAEKEKRYAEIEKETGVKAKDVLANQPRGTGAGG